MADLKAFLATLKMTFEGDINEDLATRLALSTDNSIYQFIPDALLFPKTHEDIHTIFELASQEKYQQICFSPRAGGTGTDGQSLNNGVLIDCSRHMRTIKNIDLEAKTVTVQPGVILDELNATLKPHGLFFAPSLSPSNRACIGGMFNTDACGVGSAQYGRTSDHVLSVKAVTPCGTELNTAAHHAIEKKIETILRPHCQEIETKLPKMDRFFTGYNLGHTLTDDGINLTKLLSGSEGTLAYITELTLKLTPIPKYKALIALKYRDFNSALRHGFTLTHFKPNAIETIDDKIISLARTDEIFLKVQPMFEADGPDTTTNAVNLVQFVDSDLNALQAQIEQVKNSLESCGATNGFYLTDKPNEIAAWWELRKKSVGLLANLPGNRQPVPFIEDCAVPPAKLADYIQDFCKILDEHDLIYGMFGHVDAGCIHVRPALDMTNADDAKLVKILSNKINELTLSYGGFLWAEHGAGLRSPMIETVIGKELDQCMAQIKRTFDPKGQLNPGKIVANEKQALYQTGEHLRGTREASVKFETRQAYLGAFKCNGNAICMNQMPDLAICPSYKITRDRVHSPKGRAVLMREYLIRNAAKIKAPEPVEGSFNAAKNKAPEPVEESFNAAKNKAPEPVEGSFNAAKNKAPEPVEGSFNEQVLEAMNGCLGCKSCAFSCPVTVDVPSFKAKFLNSYYKNKSRPLRDKVIAHSEQLLANIKSRWIAPLSKPILKMLGLVDLPVASSVTLKALCKQNGFEFATTKSIAKANKPVVILADMFSQYVEPQISIDFAKLIQTLGFTPLILGDIENGKGLHAKGYLEKFEKVAKKTNAKLSVISKTGTPIIGIDPALTLCFRDEYAKTLGKEKAFTVMLLSEWLERGLDSRLRGNDEKISVIASSSSARQSPRAPDEHTYYLLAHCTEKALSPKSTQYWQEAFAHFGLKLEILEAGCCGMAGSYGHEKEHLANSKGLYEMSWQDKIEQHGDRILATGYSCRCQVKRCSQVTIKHPINALLRHCD